MPKPCLPPLPRKCLSRVRAGERPCRHSRRGSVGSEEGGRVADRVPSSASAAAAAAAPRPRSTLAPTVSSLGSRAGLRRAGERPRTRLSSAGSAVGVREGGRRPPGSARGPRGREEARCGAAEWAGRAGSGFPELRPPRGLGSGAGPPALRPPISLSLPGSDKWARRLRSGGPCTRALGTCTAGPRWTSVRTFVASGESVPAQQLSCVPGV